MKPDIHPTLREALAAHETFRRLGFTPDEIYVRPTVDRFYSVVRKDGKEFVFDCGEHNIPLHRIREAWAAATAWWNAGAGDAEGARKELFETSKVRRGVVQIIVALHDKGFVVRSTDA